MNDRELIYLKARAEQELDAARTAKLAEVAKIHYLMAGLYLDRIYGAELHNEPAERARPVRTMIFAPQPVPVA